MQVTPHVHALRIPFEVRPAPSMAIKRFVYAYLQKVHDLVRQIAGPDPSIDPVDLCRQVIGRLGLPAVAANALAARSLQAHLKVLDVEDLLKA